MTDQAEELVRLAQEDAPGALDRLCAVWLPSVLGWALRLGGPRVDAEDVSHDVFLVVFDRLSDLRSPAAFQSWLFGITRRVVAAHRRKAWVRRWLPGAVPDTPDPTLGPARRAEQSEVAEQVWAALHQLSPKYREILVLCDLEERADSEVAAMLDIPKGTVKSRLRRARMQLRDRIGPLAADTFADLDAALGGHG